MKLYEFLTLPDELQYQSVWELGVHIDNIVYNHIYHQLYAIGDFYVEIRYRTRDNIIAGKLAFKAGEALEKYLVKFPLDYP